MKVMAMPCIDYKSRHSSGSSELHK